MHHFSSNQTPRDLSSNDPDLRRSALLRLNADVDPVEAQDVLPFLHDEDTAIRRVAVSLLGEIGDIVALPALLDILGSDEKDVAQAARLAIQGFRTRDTVEIFIAGAQHHQSSARVASVAALGELRSPRAIPALKKAAEDLDTAVRIAAIKSLGAFPDAVWPNGESRQAA